VSEVNASELRVVVDACAGGESLLVERLRPLLGPIRPDQCTFLSKEHRSIPDAVILRRMLGPKTVLLTRDRVLHNQACELGFRSYFLDQHGNFRRRKLPNISAPKPPSMRPDAPLQADYTHPANPIASALKGTLTERDLDRYRTRRRRIRSYFGSEAWISAASVTIGARPSAKGHICGYFLALSGTSGVKGIRASEGYALVQDDRWDASFCLIHALQQLFLLQLENVPTELFVSPPDALLRCQTALGMRTGPADPSSIEPLSVLLRGLKKVSVLPCVKGRFYDAMEAKLDQLARRHVNELVPVTFDLIINNILSRDSRELRVTSSEEPF
jgi:hypothetical protein